MLNKSLLLCANPPAIMFRLVRTRSPDRSIVNFEYTYTDPYTKQTVTKTVNSSDSEYTFPCAIGDTVTFFGLTIRFDRFDDRIFTIFTNGVDVSPTEKRESSSNTFSVTIFGNSPYIEYYSYNSGIHGSN